MADTISELLVTEAAIDKRARGISVVEARQLVYNRYAILRNPSARRRRQRRRARRLVVGRTDGGRFLALVIEADRGSDHRLIITGWERLRLSVESWRIDGQGSLDRPRSPAR